MTGRQKNCEGREKISGGRHHSSSCRKGPRPCSSFKEEGRALGGRDAWAAITQHGAAGKFFSPAPLQGVKRVDMACSSLSSRALQNHQHPTPAAPARAWRHHQHEPSTALAVKKVGV
ncbi:uncharacterized protein LOC144162891 [Haemaphysalis longicornis]